MGREKALIEGRQRSLAALRSALRHCSRRGRLVVIRGPAGIGKTKLMDTAAARWRAEGVVPVQVRVGAATDRWGVDGTIDALRRNFDRFSESRLVDGISVLTRLRAREADDPSGWFPAVATELGKVFGRIGRLGPTALLFDDVRDVADPAMLLLAVRRPGCLVVASVRDDPMPTPASTELVSLADEVIDLEPLSGEQIVAVAGTEADEEVHLALRAALRPLYGNPGTVLTTLAALRDDGRLVVERGGRLRLTDPGSAIPLPEGHDLLRRARALGGLGLRLLAAAAAFGGLHVDDLPSIADDLGGDLAECGRTVDLLVEQGLLLDDAHGRWECLCPALGASAGSEEYTGMRPLHVTMTPELMPEVRAPVDEEVRVGASGTIRDQGGAGSTMAASCQWSATEARIVDLISLGCTNRRIASELGMREKTVERHLTRLFSKTGCRSRVELVATRSEASGLAGLRGDGPKWNGPSGVGYGPAA